MAWVMHGKTTAAMATFYAASAALLFYFIRDATTQVAVLFVLFALVLVAGNIYVKAGTTARDHGTGDTKGSRGPPTLPRDPEAGRR
jgi:hypothetical protein